jgi:cell fate (sporulation/competence/biofilm development) regulator YlbF (YheA/YmcA/DUF963 family)
MCARYLAFLSYDWKWFQLKLGLLLKDSETAQLAMQNKTDLKANLDAFEHFVSFKDAEMTIHTDPRPGEADRELSIAFNTRSAGFKKTRE